MIGHSSLTIYAAIIITSLIEATQPYDRLNIEQLVIHGVHKPIISCGVPDLNRVVEIADKFVRDKALKQDIRDMAIKELMGVIQRYESHLAKPELKSILSELIQE